MANPFNKAMERVSELRREIARLESFIETYKELAGEGSQLASDGNRVSPTETVKDASPSPSYMIKAEAKKLLEEAVRPIPLAELTSAIERRGLIIGGRKPASNLSAKLSQDDEFYSVRNEGWTLRAKWNPNDSTGKEFFGGSPDGDGEPPQQSAVRGEQSATTPSGNYQPQALERGVPG